MDSQAFNRHMADRAALAERFGVQIEAVDRGSALALLRLATSTAEDPEASLLALAQTSSAAAVDSALSTILEQVDRRATHSSFTYIVARRALAA